MIEFSSDFFLGEEREGFYVDETMKRFWAAKMEVLCEITRICKKHRLTYFADWGTLLGAIRHKGWIPWDDDIDITLMRPDYDKLLDVLPEELSAGMTFYDPFHSETYKDFYLMVRNGDYINVDLRFLQKYHGCPFVASIDVMPLDVVPREPELAKAFFDVYSTIIMALRYFKEGKSEQAKPIFSTVEELCDIKFDRNKDLQNQLWCLANDLNRSVGMDDGDYVTTYPIYTERNDLLYKKSWYEKFIELPFENIMVNVPTGYDDILHVMYGDYMVPVRGTSTHDYPAYKTQLELLRNHVAELEKEVKDKGSL